jgi:hypothetical protein
VPVAGAEQIGLAGRLDLLGAGRDGVPPGRLGGPERCRAAGLAADCLRNRAGHAEEVALGVAVDVAVVGRLALHHPDAGTGLAGVLGALDPAVIE